MRPEVRGGRSLAVGLPDPMNQPEAVLERYAAALRSHGSVCHRDPTKWNAPEAEVFGMLFDELLPHARNGHVDCEYAIATILSLGLRCRTESEMLAEHEKSIIEASFWWARAASKGHWPAVDHLIGNGVGETADRAREVLAKLDRTRPELVGRSMNMPVYGSPIFEAVIQELFGKENQS